MANEETGTTVASPKAAEKSGGVSGDQAVQMLLKREAARAVAPVIADTPEPKPETPAEEPQKPATSDVEANTPEPEDAPEPAPKPTEEAPPDEALSQLSPEQKERIQKRINKEVAKRKALEDEVTRLRILANATPQVTPRTPPVQSDPDSPVARIMDPLELQVQAERALEVKDWAQAQLDAEVAEARLGDKVYDKAALRNAVRNADRFITREVPKQMQFIQEKTKADRQTAEMFGSEPWMQDRTSEGYQVYLDVLKDPDIAKRPNASWIAAVQVQGLLDLARKKAASGKPAAPAPTPKPKAPASQVASGAAFAPAREAGSGQAVKALETAMAEMRAKKGVKGKDVEAFFRLRENTRTR